MGPQHSCAGVQWRRARASTRPMRAPGHDSSTPSSIGGRGAAGVRSVRPESRAWARLLAPVVDRWEGLFEDALRPLFPLPRHPLRPARLGLYGLQGADLLTRTQSSGPRARALFGGIAGHSLLPLSHPITGALGLVLTIAGHAVGWPITEGGSQGIADALASILEAHGGEIVTGQRIDSLDELPAADAILLDLTARPVLEVAGEYLPPGYRRQLAHYRYGPGVFKIDWALSEPIPWRAPECRLSATVHLGGTFEEIAASARRAWLGEPEERPFVLLSQPTLFDPSRAPEGKHTAWAYCHVPNGSTVDMTAAIERQVERFAPGFRETILARSTFTAAEMEEYNPNLVGGEINGGAETLYQFAFRPARRLDPYRTPTEGLFLCSSSTPPGGGVHGMCGYNAARSVLRTL